MTTAKRAGWLVLLIVCALLGIDLIAVGIQYDSPVDVVLGGLLLLGARGSLRRFRALAKREQP